MRFFRYPVITLIGIIGIGCSGGEKAETANKLSQYEIYLANAEAELDTGAALGLIYVHPKRKRACNFIQVRLSELTYNGLESSWEVFDVIKIEEELTAPHGRRQIGEHPILFQLPDAEQLRIDAISCTDFSGEETPQFQTVATFKPRPGEISYIGDIQQVNLAKTVDIYTLVQESSVAERLGVDSPVLQSRLQNAEIIPFTFENYDGSFLSGDQVIENVDFGGDYFVLSQTLRTQADEALYPFLPYIPDLNLQVQNHAAQTELGDALIYNLNLAFLRQDLLEDFSAIIRADKGYETARDYVKLKLDHLNKLRALRQAKVYNWSYQERRKRNEAAKATKVTLDKLTRARGLTKVVDGNLTDERQAARDEFRKQMKRMPYVLTTPLSDNADVLVRKRIQDIMTDYIPAKYTSLKLEFSALSDLADSPPVERRRLRNLIDAAEAEEAILLRELIASFMREDLQDNGAYHDARARFDAHWDEIITIRQGLRASRTKT